MLIKGLAAGCQVQGIILNNNNYHIHERTNTATLDTYHHHTRSRGRIPKFKRKHYMKKRDDNDREEDVVGQIIQPLESLLIFLSTPIGIPNNASSSSSYALPLVYPLTIIALNLLLKSVTTIILLDVFFILFFLLARSAIIQGDDDGDGDRLSLLEDDNNDDGFIPLDYKILDLIALFGSVVSAAIVSPSGFSFDSENIGFGTYIGLILLFVCSSSGIVVWNESYNSKSNASDGGANDDDDDDTKSSDMNSYSTKLISEWDEKFKEFISDRR